MNPWLAVLNTVLGPIIGPIIDRIPNPNERARAREEFDKAVLDAASQGQSEQNAINKIEAGHKSLFVAAWRPGVGWCCVAGIAWSFFIEPILTWVAVAFAVTELETLPALDTGPLMTLIMAMLGMGTLRTLEKRAGVARNA